ncbi:PAS domain S-box protein [Maribacter sp. ANRC-HE7]|uniref:histidine kinase n=1 Tax=Maribacter aquimaris TaxID=2737171 RepID=A0ABR7V5J9_9FLAO|nr:PAS domain S-box protein [Maribacter aquimaris]MBD0778457.1 PAS domain S-box protein [Maribacter aquimaris]
MKDNPKDLSLFKHIFDASLEGILVVDQDGKILKTNTAVETMFGYGKGELLNENIEVLLPKRLREIHQKQHMDFSKAPRARAMDRALDLWGQKKDGTEFPLRISLSPIMFNNESVTIAYVRDTIDLKKGQYALKAKEAKNKALLDALPDIMVIQNFEGDIVDFYAPENTMAQVPKEEVIGKNIKQIVPQAISKKILKAHNQAIETQKIQIREYTLDINGKKTDFESRTVPLNNHKLLTIVRDITEKKSTERELKESEVKNRAVLAALPDLIFIHDKKGRILQVNASDYSPIVGPIEDLVGKNFKEILPPKISVQIQKAITKVEETKNTVLQIITVPINQKPTDFETRFVPLENETFLCVLRDVTKTKAIQDVLNVRNSALEAAGNSIIIVDARQQDLPIIYCNDAFCKLTGYERSEVLGKNCRFLQKGDRDQEGIDIIRESIRTRKTSRTLLRNYRKDGTLFYNELTITPVINKHKQLTHFIGVQNNVTDRIKELQIKDQMRQILEMIAKQKSLEKISKKIVEVLENHLVCCFASIFVLDPMKKTLHKLAAPNLPKGFCNIIEGAPLGPDMGPCGMAAYLKKEVIIPDITTDPHWAGYHDAAIKHGLVSCWSYPIFSSDQKALGIFGIYCQKQRIPTKIDKDFILELNQLIGIAIEEHQIREQLTKSHYLLEKYTRELEQTVNERTNELKATVQKMIEANLNLEDQIKETKDAENRALESQSMFTAIAKNFPKGIIIVFNADFEIDYIDGGEMRRMGMDKTDFEGRCIDNITVFKKERIHRVKNDIKRTMKGEHLSFETQFNNKYYTVNTSPLMGGNDEVKWTLFVYNDITKQKQAETEIRKALVREQELNELKSRFISMASHEFRTPLSAIHSSAILIEKQNVPGKEAKREKYVTQIKHNVKALVIILNDFLSLGKLEEGRVRPNPEIMDLVDFSKKIISDFESNRKRGQKIKVIAHEKTIEAYLDLKLMSHILTNLLSNAIKYSQEGQEILVTLLKENRTVSIKVSDQGIGIPKDEQEQLFQRFFRAKNSVNIQGTGLGLNIVKQYTELMGGSIGLESEENKGATFWVSFPASNKTGDI